MAEALPSALGGRALLVAFSGGPDSLALLLAASRLAANAGFDVVAAHLDHALDPDSAARARRAAALAHELGVHFLGQRLASERPPQESREAFARRARYDFLAAAAAKVGADFLTTAHHADDQAETVLLRLLFGSGLEGLGGVTPERPFAGLTLLRPLLGCRREELRAYVLGAGLTPIDDPTNRDPRVPRNRVRHALLPHLAAAAGEDLAPLLCRLAASGRRAAATVASRLGRLLEVSASDSGARLKRREFEALPEVLQGPALALLHRRAGAAGPAPLEARRELFAQLRRGGKVRCDCGRRGGAFGAAGTKYFWQADRYYLELRRLAADEPMAGQFTYTFEASGAEPQER